MTREEAIEIYRELINPEIIEAFQTLIPGLAESEDERVRKFIKEELEFSLAELNPTIIPEKGKAREKQLKEALAWLGKQREYKPAEPPLVTSQKDAFCLTKLHFLIRESELDDNVKGFIEDFLRRRYEWKPIMWSGKDRINYEVIRNHVEADGWATAEQIDLFRALSPDKPAEWKLPDDFEEAVYKVANFISPFNSQEELRKVSHRFAEQLLDIAKKDEQKPAEYLDKDKVYAIMKKLTSLSFCVPLGSDEEKRIHEITCDVRSLLDYPIEQKPAEWSEEDWKLLDEMRDYLMSMCYSRDLSPNHIYEGFIDLIDRLKSPRPSWKPSEEQREAFSHIVRQFKPDKELESLYNDLKKLM